MQRGPEWPLHVHGNQAGDQSLSQRCFFRAGGDHKRAVSNQRPQQREGQDPITQRRLMNDQRDVSRASHRDLSSRSNCSCRYFN